MGQSFGVVEWRPVDRGAGGCERRRLGGRRVALVDARACHYREWGTRTGGEAVPRSALRASHTIRGTTQRSSSAVDTKWCSDEGYFVALQGVYDPSGICKTFSAELPPYEVTPAIDGTSQTDEKEKAKVVDKEAKGACSKCLKQGNLDPRSWLGDAAGPSVSLRGGYTPPSRCGSWRVVMPRYISARDGSVTFAQQVHVGQTACSRVGWSTCKTRRRARAPKSCASRGFSTLSRASPSFAPRTTGSAASMGCP